MADGNKFLNLDEALTGGVVSRRVVLRRTLGFGLSLPVVLVALQACGDDDDDAEPVVEDTPEPDDDDDVAEEPTPEEEDGDEVAEGVTVEAVDIDFNPIEFTIAADTDVVVTFVNNGGVEHTFTIDELDIDEVLAPGEEVEITINAEAGEYTYFCREPGHREAGQEGIMTVE